MKKQVADVQLGVEVMMPGMDIRNVGRIARSGSPSDGAMR